MALHESTFVYLQPTDAQIDAMNVVREGFAQFAEFLDAQLSDGPDKTYVIRKLRDCAMWSNVCLTREPDGTPRD
jgi:hypothetical protein